MSSCAQGDKRPAKMDITAQGVTAGAPPSRDRAENVAAHGHLPRPGTSHLRAIQTAPLLSSRAASARGIQARYPAICRPRDRASGCSILFHDPDPVRADTRAHPRANPDTVVPHAPDGTICRVELATA